MVSYKKKRGTIECKHIHTKYVCKLSFEYIHTCICMLTYCMLVISAGIAMSSHNHVHTEIVSDSVCQDGMNTYSYRVHFYEWLELHAPT